MNKARLAEAGRGIIQFENASPQTDAELTRKVADKTELIASIFYVTSMEWTITEVLKSVRKSASSADPPKRRERNKIKNDIQKITISGDFLIIWYSLLREEM